ncbi:MAG: SLBB domain-containing protein [Nitrospirae bacterium]|nr:SLBB domain-containing protein [Nitrospirota bacterium]
MATFIALAVRIMALLALSAGALAAEVTENSTFKTVSGVPEYRLGPGDQLEVVVTHGVTQDKYDATVAAGGSITAGIVRVGIDGLTVGEASARVEDELRKFVREPYVTISVKDYRSKSVTLLGAVLSQSRQPTGPGVYYLSGRTTVMELLGAAGGPSDKANLERVQVNRAGGTLHVNLYRTLTLGDTEQDLVLDDGDTVYVPERATSESKVYVFGEVTKPGVYPYNRDMGLLQAISLAQGYTKYAVMDEVRIIRGSAEKTDVITASVEGLLEDGDLSQDIALLGNDIVYVPRSGMGDWNDFVDKVMPTIQLITAPLNTMTQIKYLSQ